MALYDEVLPKTQADNVGGLQALQCLTVYMCRAGTAHQNLKIAWRATQRVVPTANLAVQAGPPSYNLLKFLPLL